MQDGFVKIKSKSRSCSEGVALWRRQEQQVEHVIPSLKLLFFIPNFRGSRVGSSNGEMETMAKNKVTVNLESTLTELLVKTSVTNMSGSILPEKPKDWLAS